MDITTTNTEWNYTLTGYFNDKPIKISCGCDVWLPQKDFSIKETHKLVDSEDFQTLSKAGFEVHGMLCEEGG